MPTPQQELARAKLNLSLAILGKRPDGYHQLQSLVAFADSGDLLEAVPAETLTLHVTGEFAEAAGQGEANLVLRAAQALQRALATEKGAALTLTKHIPVGAGLGGGSADAAATLRLLPVVWNLPVPQQTLYAIASTIGADVAMCLTSKPAIASGIGDELSPWPGGSFPAAFAVLVHPRVPLLTADVYRAMPPRPLHAAGAIPAIHSYAALVGYLSQHGNDLEAPARTICPQLQELLGALKALHPTPDIVRMTGSGACCFALYETRAQAETGARRIRELYPHWWVSAVALG